MISNIVYMQEKTSIPASTILKDSTIGQMTLAATSCELSTWIRGGYGCRSWGTTRLEPPT